MNSVNFWPLSHHLQVRSGQNSTVFWIQYSTVFCTIFWIQYSTVFCTVFWIPDTREWDKTESVNTGSKNCIAFTVATIKTTRTAYPSCFFRNCTKKKKIENMTNTQASTLVLVMCWLEKEVENIQITIIILKNSYQWLQIKYILIRNINLLNCVIVF